MTVLCFLELCLNAYEQNTETDESFDVSHRMQNITWCTHDHFFFFVGHAFVTR